MKKIIIFSLILFIPALVFAFTYNWEIDYCEYSSDAAAQAAYVSSDEGLQSFIAYTEVDVGSDITVAQHKITAVDYDATDVSYVYRDFGASYFDALKIKWKSQIESASEAGCAGGVWLSTVVAESAGAATNIGVYLNKESGGYRAVLIRGNFGAYDPTDYVLSAGTPYYFLLERAAGNDTATVKIYDDSAMTNLLDTLTITGLGTTKWRYLYGLNHFGQATAYYWDGFVENLDLCGVSVFSESTIKTQGTYSLKGVAAITDSLDDTLTRTIGDNLDLSNMTGIEYDIYALRTGSNIKIGLHDSGGTTSEHTANVASSNTNQTESWDISGVSDANKDDIDSIIVTISNADAANTFYLDDIKWGIDAVAGGGNWTWVQ